MKHARRVGLITFHHVPNFGAFLQAWSLVQVLRKLGCEAEVIDYRPMALKEKGRRTGWRSYVPSLGRWRMGRFMLKNLPLSPLCRTREDVAMLVQARGYESLVCGSDQIWMKDDYVGFDSTYYLDVVDSNATRRISYAPSCGSMSSYGEHGETVTRLLSRFDAISARDAHTVRLLASVGITDVTPVVDPTLLADFAPLIRRQKSMNKYLVIVGPVDDRASQLSRLIADRLGLPMIAVGTRCPIADREERFVHAGEWVSYVANSSFVITSLFHGAALAIRFRKPFVAVDAGGRGFKLLDLLDNFGLAHRYLSRDHGREYAFAPHLLEMQYETSEQRIGSAIAGSLGYLQSALHGRS